MQTMTTNEVYHHIIRLLQIHKDKDFLIEIFQSRGVDATKAKLGSWDNKHKDADKYREMPREVLDVFIDELYVRKLVQVQND